MRAPARGERRAAAMGASGVAVEERSRRACGPAAVAEGPRALAFMDVVRRMPEARSAGGPVTNGEAAPPGST